MNRLNRFTTTLLLFAAAALSAGCADTPLTEPNIAPRGDPLLSEQGRPAVLVNPNARGNGTVSTIQEGIDRVAPGGKVLVLPGTYEEAVVIEKALTLEGIGGASGPVIIAPPAGTPTVVDVRTSAPVTLRNLTVHVPDANGIRGIGAVDLAVEGSVVLSVDPPEISVSLIAVVNDGVTSGRATLAVRHTTIDGMFPAAFARTFGIQVVGDVDAVLQGNAIRRTGGACIVVVMRNDLGGELNADILDNELDDCQPLGRVAAVIVGPSPMNVPTAERPSTATGEVNIVGNTILNSSASCLTSSAIVYESYTGRIEHNRILGVVQDCATGSPRNLPSAIWIGAIRPFPSAFPPVTPVVRFNDVAGNAFAGLRIAPNQTIAIDATCNYWGSADGPSGIGTGNGDAVLVEPEGAPPLLVPFAQAPIAESAATGC
jgi:hypothetical protein